MMKFFYKLAICLTCVFMVGACSQKGHAENEQRSVPSPDKARRGPIKANTTMISYGYHTNSGIAISINYKIYRDSLVWDYHEYRNDCHLRDVVTYDGEDYEQLISSLSQVSFSAKDMHDHSAGGSGYGYGFAIGDKTYLSFNNTFKLSGDFQSVRTLISQFIETHPTQAESIFKNQAAQPHEKATFGEFETLPEDLEPYRVGK